MANAPTRPRRLHKTAVDYVAIAIAPVLIMVLIGSLVFFLVDAVYTGQFVLRLKFIFAMFVIATTLIGRISIEEGKEHALLFAIPLAVVSLMATSMFARVEGELAVYSFYINAFILAIIWFFAHQLTWDCTLIDDQQDASGQGLLEAAGMDNESSEAGESAAGNPELSTTSRDNADRTWWQWYKERQKRPHAPGLWVIYFSLGALALFGVVSSFIPEDKKAGSFQYVVVFVAAALALLMSTSFLGLRRYLRQRRVEMSGDMAATWLSVGTVLIVLLLVFCALLPRPGGMTLSSDDMPLTWSSPTNLKTSKHGMGSEGLKTKQSFGGGSKKNQKKSSYPTTPRRMSADGKRPMQSNKGNQSKQGRGNRRQQGQNRQQGQRSFTNKKQGASQHKQHGGKGQKQSVQQRKLQGGKSSSQGSKKVDQQQSSNKQDLSKQSSNKQGSSKQSSNKQGSSKQSSNKQRSSKQESQNSHQQDSGKQRTKQSLKGNQSSKDRQPKGSGSRKTAGKKGPGQDSGKQKSNDESNKKKSVAPKGRNKETEADGKKKANPNPDQGNKQDRSNPARSFGGRSSRSDKQEQQDARKEQKKNDNSERSRGGAGRAAKTKDKQANKSAGSSKQKATPPKTSWKLPKINFSKGFILILKLLFYGGLILAAVYFGWKYRQEIYQAWLNFLDELRKLFGGRQTPRESADTTETPRHQVRPFASYANPFQGGGRMPPEALVHYTFEAFVAWARENGCAKDVDDTPLEFAQHVAVANAPMAAASRRFAEIYCRLAYDSHYTPTAQDVETLRFLWTKMQS